MAFRRCFANFQCPRYDGRTFRTIINAPLSTGSIPYRVAGPLSAPMNDQGCFDYGARPCLPSNLQTQICNCHCKPVPQQFVSTRALYLGNSTVINPGWRPQPALAIYGPLPRLVISIRLLVTLSSAWQLFVHLTNASSPTPFYQSGASRTLDTLSIRMCLRFRGLGRLKGAFEKHYITHGAVKGPAARIGRDGIQIMTPPTTFRRRNSLLHHCDPTDVQSEPLTQASTACTP